MKKRVFMALVISLVMPVGRWLPLLRDSGTNSSCICAICLDTVCVSSKSSELVGAAKCFELSSMINVMLFSTPYNMQAQLLLSKI